MLKGLVGVVGKAKMAVSSGTQTGVMYPKSMGGYVIDLLEKLNEIKGVYGNIKDELNTGQRHIDQNEGAVENMQVSIRNISTTMDRLGAKMLENNLPVAQRNLQIQRVKDDILMKKEQLHRIREQVEGHNLQQHEQSITVLKKEREILERRLLRINHDIQRVYEELYETQERLTALRDRKLTIQENEELALVMLRDQSSSAIQRQEQLLSISEPEEPLNMHDLYVSPAKLRQMQTEIEELKHKQFLFDKHIQSQLEERDFLRITADEIVQKVYHLEKIVRKEKGDHNPESPLTEPPVWRQDLSGPKLWYQAPSYTVEQLKRLMAEEYQKHPAHRNWTEEPGTSGYGDSDEVIESNICLETVPYR